MNDEKYITFKRKEFNAYLDEVGDDMLPPEIEDAVVIRLQDAFAPPALDSYANSILLVVEMLNSSKGNEELIERLQPVADYFRMQAEEAWGLHRKLPD